MSGPYVVILTGGALPGQEKRADPTRAQLDLAVERGNTPGVSPDVRDRHIAEEAWLLGYAEGATLHRVVAAWVLDGKDEAERFAEFVTREIDPAYVTAARSAVAELLTAADQARYPAPQDGVPF